MKKEDAVLRGLVYNGEVSLAVADTTALTNEAIRLHGLTPVAAAALGRVLAAGTYLSSALKTERGAVSVTVKGNGPGGEISVSGDSALRMRGYIGDPNVSLPPNAAGKLDVGGCVGRSGTLTVVRDDGEGIPFVGTTELVSGEIGEDFAAYFAYSEQIPTAVAVGVRIGTDGKCLGAGGVFLQPMPGAGEESIVKAERAISRFSQVSALLSEHTAKEIWDAFFGDDPGNRILYEKKPEYKCICSRAYIGGLLLSLGKEELDAILREEGEVSVHCHYCNTDYRFTGEEVEALWKAGRTDG